MRGNSPSLQRPITRQHRRYSETYTELLYLEYLRGLPGIPTLHGAWFENVTRSEVRVAYVVADAGATLDASAYYDAWVRAAPLGAARAWLRLGQSFAEVGGFVLTDFKRGAA